MFRYHSFVMNKVKTIEFDTEDVSSVSNDTKTDGAIKAKHVLCQIQMFLLGSLSLSSSWWLLYIFFFKFLKHLRPALHVNWSIVVFQQLWSSFNSFNYKTLTNGIKLSSFHFFLILLILVRWRWQLNWQKWRRKKFHQEIIRKSQKQIVYEEFWPRKWIELYLTRSTPPPPTHTHKTKTNKQTKQNINTQNTPLTPPPPQNKQMNANNTPPPPPPPPP